VRAWTKTRYHECVVCGLRSRFPRSPRDSSDPGIDVLFWVAVVLLGVGFVFLLLRVG